MVDATPADCGSQDAQQAPAIARGHSTMPAIAQPPTASSPPHQLHGDTRSDAFVSQFDMTKSSAANQQSSFDMNAMATALPHVVYNTSYGPGPQAQQMPYPGVASSMPAQQYPQPQYGVQGVPVQNPQYYLQQGYPMQQYYSVPMYHAHPPSEPPQARQNMVYAQGWPSTHSQPPDGSQQYQYYPASSSFSTSGQPQPRTSNWSASPPRKQVDPRTAPPSIVTGSSGRGVGWADGRSPRANSNASKRVEESSPADENGGVVRGPPRKPKQRGYAIWIGNLPPHADLMSLVNHVCKEAPGLDSLFLISKSNCAFANFKDEQSCFAAQSKLHDSRFQTVRLVSRLRKGAVERPGIPMPAVDDHPSASSSAPASDGPVFDGDMDDTKETSTPPTSPSKSNPHSGGEAVLSKDRYFILKSLTLEDLETSVRNGIWATQFHNEELLNSAFKAADDVYLFFSANKSGEYFGYARMTSPVNEDPNSAIQFAPAAQPSNALDLPKAIPTDATQFAPKGRIIDDSKRGTLFWEVGRDEIDGGDENRTDGESLADADGDTESDSLNSWGKPFKLEWISTSRVPFFRTRGLRNPWNANREVKIARDGTELETGVGRRLVGLFSNNVPGVALPGAGGMVGHHAGAHGRPYH